MPDLRDYQIEDVKFLMQRDSAGCFNEQRTGKTPTSITIMKQKEISKLVVVCPASAIYPWVEEYELWDGRKAIPIVGTKIKKEKLIASWTEGAIVISYGSLKETSRSDGMIDLILKHKPTGIILDEAHRIKNYTSANAKAAFRCVYKIQHRLALTGTPAPNKTYEVWSILKFINPKGFSSYWNFIEEFYNTVAQQNYTTQQSYTEILDFKPGKAQELQEILATLSTQRKRKDVMPWLPDKNYIDVKLPATKKQKKYLQELSDYFETGEVIVQGVLDRLIRYRQICLHPKLIGLTGKSPKLEWIFDYIADYPEVPTIIFSKFTSFIKILCAELYKANIKYASITGSTPIPKRHEHIQAFQKGKYNILVLNIDACKEALTLDKAEAAIFTDKYPPISDIAQAEDRFVATTVDKANKGHKIYNLMIKDTYDEELHKLIKQRATEVDIINNYNKYLKRR